MTDNVMVDHGAPRLCQIEERETRRNGRLTDVKTKEEEDEGIIRITDSSDSVDSASMTAPVLCSLPSFVENPFGKIMGVAMDVIVVTPPPSAVSSPISSESSVSAQRDMEENTKMSRVEFFKRQQQQQQQQPRQKRCHSPTLPEPIVASSDFVVTFPSPRLSTPPNSTRTLRKGRTKSFLSSFSSRSVQSSPPNLALPTAAGPALPPDTIMTTTNTRLFVAVQINGRIIPSLEMSYKSNSSSSKDNSCRFLCGNSIKPSTQTLEELIASNVLHDGKNLLRYLLIQCDDITHHHNNDDDDDNQNSNDVSVEMKTQLKTTTMRGDDKKEKATITFMQKREGNNNSANDDNHILLSNSTISSASSFDPSSSSSNVSLPAKTSPTKTKTTNSHHQILGSAEATLYLWSSQDIVVISDIDGTVTKSDVRGVLDTIVTEKYEHAHFGVCKFFTNIAKFCTTVKKNKKEDEEEDEGQGTMMMTRRNETSYEEKEEEKEVTENKGKSSESAVMKGKNAGPKVRFLYLSSRPMSVVNSTRKFLASLTQVHHEVDDSDSGVDDVEERKTQQHDVTFGTSNSQQPPPASMPISKQNSILKRSGSSIRSGISTSASTAASMIMKRPKTYKLPPGPIFCHTGSLSTVLFTELVTKTTHEFKADVLARQVVLPFAAAGKSARESLFLAGFGNKGTDAMAYEMAGVNRDDIYIINKESKIVCMDKADPELSSRSEPVLRRSSDILDPCPARSEPVSRRSSGLVDPESPTSAPVSRRASDALELEPAMCDLVSGFSSDMMDNSIVDNNDIVSTESFEVVNCDPIAVFVDRGCCFADLQSNMASNSTEDIRPEEGRVTVTTTKEKSSSVIRIKSFSKRK